MVQAPRLRCITAKYELPTISPTTTPFMCSPSSGQPDKIEFFVDEFGMKKRYAGFNAGQGQVGCRTSAVFILLNAAVGGDWPGNPDSSTVFPRKEMLVDYVRVCKPVKIGLIAHRHACLPPGC